MTYLQIRKARLASPIACAQCPQTAVAGSDYCAECRPVAKAAQTKGQFVVTKRIAILVVCLLPFSAAVGAFCPAPFVPVMILAGLLAAVPLAALIVGGQSENA